MPNTDFFDDSDDEFVAPPTAPPAAVPGPHAEPGPHDELGPAPPTATPTAAPKSLADILASAPSFLALTPGDPPIDVTDAETDAEQSDEEGPTGTAEVPSASSSTGAPAGSGLGALIDIDRAAANAEVVMRDLRNRAIAIVYRNLDGANGRHILESAGIEPSQFLPLNCPRMAAGNRTSSVTTGSTETNDIFQLRSRNMQPPPHSLQMVEVARELMARVRDAHIFTQPKEELFCSLRVHAFPPKDPRGAPPAGLKKMMWGQGPEEYALHRQPSEREGGRLHGHRDEVGTDGVVVLNMGSGDFFFCTTTASKNGCTSQREKECWCVGNGGHWAQKADCPPERYEAHYSKPEGKLLRDRLCAACAGGRDAGVACASCTRNTVRLRSGDVLIFHGRDAFHGLSAVVPESPPPPPPPQHAPQLPPWARSELDGGGRISVQWRLSNTKKFKEKENIDTENWNTSGEGLPPGARRYLQPSSSMGGGGMGGGGMGGGGMGGAQQLGGDEFAVAAIEEQQLQQAMAASMASLQQQHFQQPQAGAAVPMTASCEQEQLQQAIAASLVQQPALVSLLDASELPMARPPVTRPLVARPLRGSGKSKDAPMELSSDDDDDDKQSTLSAAAAPIAATAPDPAAAPSATPVESGGATAKRSRSDGGADEAVSSVPSPKALLEDEQDRVRKARLARFA